jgi:hypothetical protein
MITATIPRPETPDQPPEPIPEDPHPPIPMPPPKPSDRGSDRTRAAFSARPRPACASARLTTALRP